MIINQLNQRKYNCHKRAANPLDIMNSIDSANEIRDVLTDNDRNNDQLVCDLIDSEDEYTISKIRGILNY